MRDFYDVFILFQLNGPEISSEELTDSLKQTMKYRKTYHLLGEASRILADLRNSDLMKNRWAAYQDKFAYANSVDWSKVIRAVEILVELSSTHCKP